MTHTSPLSRSSVLNRQICAEGISYSPYFWITDSSSLSFLFYNVPRHILPNSKIRKLLQRLTNLARCWTFLIQTTWRLTRNSCALWKHYMYICIPLCRHFDFENIKKLKNSPARALWERERERCFIKINSISPRIFSKERNEHAEWRPKSCDLIFGALSNVEKGKRKEWVRPDRRAREEKPWEIVEQRRPLECRAIPPSFRARRLLDGIQRP